jgi:hypothetical protein
MSRRMVPTIIMAVILVPGVLLAGDVQICRIEGGSVNIGNFPTVQPVSIDKIVSPLEIRDVGLVRTYSQAIDLAVGEKRPLGPFPLIGKRRGLIQISQMSPARQLAPVRARWFVRFDESDAFFDPCPATPGPSGCAFGLAGGGTKMRPAPLAKEVETMENIPLTSVEVSVASLDIIGTEGLLTIENTTPGPVKLKVNVVLDR